MSIFTVKIGDQISNFVAQFDGKNWSAVFPNGHYFSCDAMPTAPEIQERIDAAIKRRGIEKVSKSFLAHRFGGYTPVALTNLLHIHSKSREDCAAILSVSLNSVDRWCVGLESKRHADMALELWERLNVYLAEHQETPLCDYRVVLLEPTKQGYMQPCVRAHSIASAKAAAYQEFGSDIKIARVELA